jgi:DNA-binding IclR family transcriptional regulator
MRIVKGAVERCFDVLELLAAQTGWVRLSDIAHTMALQKGPTHRLLAQLLAMGWVEQNTETEQYRLSLKLAMVGQQYLHSIGLPGMVQPIIDALSQRCKELVRVTVVQDHRLVWLASAQGAAPGLMYQPSMSGAISLHTTANGKAWLGTMSNDEAANIVLKAGVDKGHHTQPVKPLASLLSELDQVRAQGYGLSEEDAEAGVTAIAVAVYAASSQQVLGTISIAGPCMRVTPEMYAPYYALLQQAAQQLGTIWPLNTPQRQG